KPFHVRHDKERDEDGTEQNRNGRRYITESAHRNDGHVRHQHTYNGYEIAKALQNIEHQRHSPLLYTELESGATIPNLYMDRVVGAVGEVGCWIDDEMVKTDAESWEGTRIIGNHAETQGDRDEETRKAVKMDERRMAAAGGRERALSAEPGNQNDR